MQGDGDPGGQQSHSPDASPPTPERRWSGKLRRETATSDVCADLANLESQPAAANGKYVLDGREATEPHVDGPPLPVSPGGSGGSEAAGVARESSQPATSADATRRPAGQRGGSEASQQLQALAHHLMDEVSQVRFRLSGYWRLCCEGRPFKGPLQVVACGLDESFSAIELVLQCNPAIAESVRTDPVLAVTAYEV